jgi:hypothetical protein
MPVFPNYPNLKKQTRAGAGTNLEPWSKENLFDGFKKFFNENGRYPTAEEIDENKFLPSARQIQRAFGGLQNLRKNWGLPIINYNTGENRSRMSLEISKRGIKGEREIEKILTDRFGEHFVHIEKPLYKYFPAGINFKSKLRSDFFVYHKDGVFCVDVFYAKNKNMINGNLNIKRRKYEGILIKTYFVVLSDKIDFTQELIDHTLNRKKNKLDENITTMNKESFLVEILKYTRLTVNK